MIILHCLNSKSDKVWGVECLSNGGYPWDPSYWDPCPHIIFWGRRGNQLQHKLVTMPVSHVNNMILGKEAKGYVNYDINTDPDLKAQVEKLIMWNKISN